jgi:hypothetical protein
MYHFFAKNEELKSKKESKTSILEARLVSVGPPSSTSWDPSSTCWGPIYTYLYMSSILFKSPIYVHATIHLTPKVLRVFFIKTASKQPLFKARYIMQILSLL